MKTINFFIPLSILFLLFAWFNVEVSLAQKNTELIHPTDTEHYFSFSVSDKSMISRLSKVISIDKVSFENEVFKVIAYANNSELENFRKFKIPFTLMEHPARKAQVKMLNTGDLRSTNSWDYYPTYDAYVQMMYQFQTTYPELCQVYNIGQTPNNHALLYAKISANVDQNEAEPKFNYTSSMHGDELTGYVLMLRLIDHLLSNYGSDTEVTQLLDSTEIWINPLANPDGTFNGGNNTVTGAIRYNSNYIDINRNFPDWDDGPHPDGNAWQPETQYFMSFADSVHFVMAANLHTGSEVINYPWDTEINLHPANTWWVHVSSAYADTVHANAVTGYLTDLNNGITNGYAWYTISGGRQDYMNYYHRTREATMELSSVKTPASSSLPSYWTYNFRSLMNYMKEAQYGIRGFITDSITGLPLEANVFISGHDNLNTDVYSSLPYGDYYRPIAAGTWTVTYSCPGYQTKTISNIVVTNGAATYLDVQLVAISPVVAFDAEEYSSCTGKIQFVDLTNTSQGSSYLWNFGDGTNSTEINPLHEYLFDGSYDVSLTVTNSAGTSSYTQTAFITIDRPDLPTIVPDSVCGSGAVTLEAYGSDSIFWFNNLQSDSVIFTGNTYFIPYIDSSLSFYVQNVQSNPAQDAAKPDNSGGGSYYMNNTQHYLVFDAYSDFTLESVKVYANYSGNRLIQLTNDQGIVLEQADVYIPDGEQTIQLNFSVPAGTGLHLGGPAAPGLYRNNNGLNYPYTLNGILSVTGSSANSDPTGYYYYFYNWQVKLDDCYSSKVEISASILNDTPTANFTFSNNGDSILFNNQSIFGGSYSWDFGDGSFSTEENPVHLYNATGNYQVQLITNNVCGSDTASQMVNVIITNLIESEAYNMISLFPNPATQSLRIQLVQGKISSLKVFDLLGKNLLSEILLDQSNHSIDISGFAKGIYIIRIESQNHFYQAKFIKE